MRDAQRISTVVTPAPSYDLISLSVLKTLLGVGNTTSDAFFTLALSMASAAAARHCKQPFVVETVQDVFSPPRDVWPHVVREDEQWLQLSRWPVSPSDPSGDALAPVIIETRGTTQTTLVQGTDYRIDAANGFVIRLNEFGFPRPWRFHQVQATYPAGYATIPLDIVEAISLMVKARWYSQMRDPTVRQETAEGIASQSFWLGAGPGVESDMTLEVRAKLDRYRVPTVA